ncbi:MAG: hypothetical protein QM638_16755 [Nocardioides sp.]|uniref:hypothetical protein n=1 Tax=Nocardioides sp. TaxID=35761 RepID=UPI0039E56F19
MAARRVRLPEADDLFRLTAPATPAAPAADREATTGSSGTSGKRTGRRPSGRVRHDEKMTVYITSDELLDLEHARLALRRNHGVAVDRGRLVREAVAIVLADLEANGEQSAIIRRLAAE